MRTAMSRRYQLARHLNELSIRETRKQFRNLMAGLAWAGLVVTGLVALDALYSGHPGRVPDAAETIGTLAPSVTTIGAAVGHYNYASFTPEQAKVPHLGLAGETAIARALDHHKWRSALARHEASLATARPGDASLDPAKAAAVAEWHALIDSIRPLSRRRQVDRVQAFFNRFHHATDTRLWQSRDYWASPLETMMAGAGDCEDIAIARFLALRAAGIDDSDLRLLVVSDTRRDGAAHALVTVNRYDGVPHGRLVLDNLRTGVGGDDALSPYKPIYALNETTFWAYGLDALRYRPAAVRNR